MDIKALKYLNTLADDQQYPGARCVRDDPKVFINQHQASSSVESMNNANKSAHARMSVDDVCSTTLHMEMCSIRYQAKKEEAWKWEDTLTPYGIKLRDAAFEHVLIEEENGLGGCSSGLLGEFLGESLERKC
jgi:hypothetical protein